MAPQKSGDDRGRGAGRDGASLRWVALLILLAAALAGAAWLVYRVFVAFSGWFSHYDDVG